MPVHIAQADLPYTPQQVFDLVADIERYPQFLRHVVAARIRQRDGNKLLVDQVVQFKLIRVPFRTRAEFDPPKQIHVVCTDSKFGTLDERWEFTAAAAGTHLQCHTNYQFRSGLLRIALDPMLGALLKATVQAFEARARQLYGPVPS